MSRLPLRFDRRRCVSSSLSLLSVLSARSERCFLRSLLVRPSLCRSEIESSLSVLSATVFACLLVCLSRVSLSSPRLRGFDDAAVAEVSESESELSESESLELEALDVDADDELASFLDFFRFEAVALLDFRCLLFTSGLFAALLLPSLCDESR